MKLRSRIRRLTQTPYNILLIVRCKNVPGGIAAENRLLESVALLDLGILNFGIMPACAKAPAESRRIDSKLWLASALPDSATFR